MHSCVSPPTLRGQTVAPVRGEGDTHKCMSPVAYRTVSTAPSMATTSTF